MSINRFSFTIIFFTLIFFFLVYKLYTIQILKSEELTFYAERQQTRNKEISPVRGLIYDRNGLLLVYNRIEYSFSVDMRMARKKEQDSISKIFSKTFNKPAQHYLNLMRNSKRIVFLERNVYGEAVSKLKKLSLPGFAYEEIPSRVYQYDDLAGHLLGYTNSANIGIDGVERTFNKELAGTKGNRKIVRDAIGNMITVENNEYEPSISGNNILLTIQKNVQSFLQTSLDSGLATFGATSATGVVMDPNTGEIIALANVEDYNPNEYSDYTNEQRRNRSITDTYEPGSTFKSFAMAAFLDNKICRADELIYGENGRYRFKRITISDVHPEEWMTVKEVFAKSSNIGMSKLSQRISDEDFFTYLRGFGFGNATNISLPGEVNGSLKKPNSWSSYTKSSLSFGYEISVTPIQLVTAYSSLINGGLLFEPQLMKKITDGGERIVQEFKPKNIRRVISEETSKKMREFLVAAVEIGSGKKAKINNISIGGKTGTSRQLIDGKYSTEFYNSSFVGFFPAENPSYVILILVNAPTKSSIYGGDVAAPIFRNVAKKIIENDPSLKHKISDPAENEEFIFAKTVVDTLDSRRINVVADYSTDIAMIDNNIIPDLRGRSLREAINVASKLNLKYEIIGSGRIIDQSIAYGTKVSPGLKIKLYAETNLNLGATLY